MKKKQNNKLNSTYLLKTADGFYVSFLRCYMFHPSTIQGPTPILSLYLCVDVYERWFFLLSSQIKKLKSHYVFYVFGRYNFLF